MGCKPSPYATKGGPPGWRSSEKPPGSPPVRLRGVAKERSKGATKGQARGPGAPEDRAAKLLNELEQLDVRDRHWFINAFISELLQHELIQRNPFAALNSCLRAIRVAESRHLVTGVRLCRCQLEAIFSRVVGMVYDHKRGDVQTIIDALYDVRPRGLYWLFPFQPPDFD